MPSSTANATRPTRPATKIAALLLSLALAAVLSSCNASFGFGNDDAADLPDSSLSSTGVGESAQVSSQVDSSGQSNRGVVQVGDSQQHPNGVTVTINTIDVQDSSTVVDFVAANPRPIQIRLNGCGDICEVTYLQDDLGNRYFVDAPAQNDDLIVGPAGATLAGTLVFPGAVAEGASTLSLVFSDRGDEHLYETNTSWPEFRFGPYGLGGSPSTLETTAAGVRYNTPILLGDTQRHPNDVLVAIKSIELREAGTVVEIEATNPRRVQVRLNGCGDVCEVTYLQDDLGNRYPVNAPANNDDLIVGENGGQLVGTLVFDGRIDPNASTVALVISDRGDGHRYETNTSWPEFRFGPWSVR